jgi:hypothetical protein
MLSQKDIIFGAVAITALLLAMISLLLQGAGLHPLRGDASNKAVSVAIYGRSTTGTGNFKSVILDTKNPIILSNGARLLPGVMENNATGHFDFITNTFYKGEDIYVIYPQFLWPNSIEQSR